MTRAGGPESGPLRIPPGQSVTRGFPVLHFGPVPRVARDELRLRVHGAVERPEELDWVTLQSLPQVEWVRDFHCVTRWSRLDNAWRGVPLAAVAERCGVRDGARFVRFADGGAYDTSMPIEHVGETVLAHTLDGEPLTPEHGGPLRAVVPSLYGWKSCKWLRAVEFLSEDRLGFWEVRGYANAADPWREQRLV